jgi:hypothetical protein
MRRALSKFLQYLRRQKKYLLDSWRLKKCDPQALKDVLEIIPGAWLFAGTLLGAIRDKGIIKWDRDIDVGCLCDEIDENVIARLIAAGFSIKRHFILDEPKMARFIPNDMGKTGKLILERNGTKVEICCFAAGVIHPYLKCEVLYYAGGTSRFFILPKSFIYPLIQYELYGTKVNIPKNYEQQLAFIYGDNWRHPQRHWYCTADHYLCRERTIIEIGEDDGTKWSKWTGRKVIKETYGVSEFPADINEPFYLKCEHSKHSNA